MIITGQTTIEEIILADEFKDYHFSIKRSSVILGLLEYAKINNKKLLIYLDDKGVMRVKTMD